MSRLKRDTPLRSARKARTLNQEQFARLLGISQETLSRVERGHPLARDLQERAAAILGMPRADLFPSDSEAVAS